MIEIRDQDWYTSEYRDGEQDDRLLQQLKEARKQGKENDPISFPTTNYDTYILKHKNWYLVYSCHNHYWQDLNGYTWDVPKAIQNDESFGDGELCLLPAKAYFWFPRYGTYGKQVRDSWNHRTWCSNREHYGALVKLKDEQIVCLECEQEKKRED